MTAVVAAVPFVPLLAGVAAVSAFMWFTRHQPKHRPKT